MKTTTITAYEYAQLYGCSKRNVTQNLQNDIGMVGMVSWKKGSGKTSSWLIEVLKDWYDSKK